MTRFEFEKKVVERVEKLKQCRTDIETKTLINLIGVGNEYLNNLKHFDGIVRCFLIGELMRNDFNADSILREIMRDIDEENVLFYVVRHFMIYYKNCREYDFDAVAAELMGWWD